MATYKPRVLLCGDEKIFLRTIGDKPAEVVGKIIFERTGDAVNLFHDGRALTGKDIRELLNGTAEYLIFTDDAEFLFYRQNFPLNMQVISVAAFAKKIRDGFFSNEMLLLLKEFLRREKFSGRVLDFDCYFAKSDFHTSYGLTIALECVAENFGGLYPVHENLYGKIYRTFDDCKFHIFDALLLTRERTPAEFVDALIKLDDLSENILTFVRKNSALESWLADSKNIFAAIKNFPATNGAWCLIKKRVPPADVCIYVVTHKDIRLALPEGYRAIHAGHAQAKNFFGYVGDDTGDNISRLNKFLDEITALYWIWKNTSHTHTGFVHYRRFLTTSTQKTFDAEKILSSAEILELLREYDIIVAAEESFTDRTQRDMMIFSTNAPELVDVSEKILRKHLTRTHPDYLDAFDAVMNGFVFFMCGIHITRRNIFNAWCEWLFAFIIDATEELRAKVQFDGKDFDDVPHHWSRMMSFFAERLLTVWLMKNHLRIKALPLMFRDDV